LQGGHLPLAFKLFGNPSEVDHGLFL
jgi:hypothetical protein